MRPTSSAAPEPSQLRGIPCGRPRWPPGSPGRLVALGWLATERSGLPLVSVVAAFAGRPSGSVGQDGVFVRGPGRKLRQKSRSPLLPIAMATLRSNPLRFVRFTGDPRNCWLNSSAIQAGEPFESRIDQLWAGCELGSTVCGWLAFWFQGQTSWQMSQPKTWRPMGARSSSGIGPRFSMVR